MEHVYGRFKRNYPSRKKLSEELTCERPQGAIKERLNVSARQGGYSATNIRQPTTTGAARRVPSSIARRTVTRQFLGGRVFPLSPFQALASLAPRHPTSCCPIRVAPNQVRNSVARFDRHEGREDGGENSDAGHASRMSCTEKARGAYDFLLRIMPLLAPADGVLQVIRS